MSRVSRESRKPNQLKIISVRHDLLEDRGPCLNGIASIRSDQVSPWALQNTMQKYLQLCNVLGLAQSILGRDLFSVTTPVSQGPPRPLDE
jgi:hypothetical protein